MVPPPDVVSRAGVSPYVPRVLARWWAEMPARSTRVVDGTLVSADISGFTKLSERLAGFGRRGAEELTDVVNDCFGAMIAICEEEGGDVLKFGGDALLVLFDGTDHAARACAAAVRMRESIRRPLVAPSAGRVRLQMSVGVHTGAFPLVLVRAGHHELLVTGPDVTATVACEAEASAGEILVGPATARLVDRACLAAASGERRRLRRAPSRDDIVELRGVSAGVSLDALVPRAQREQIAAGAPGEHRHVVVAFVRFSSTDRVVADDGVEALAERLQRLATAVAAATERHGVHWLASDVCPDGGKVILTAGAPTSEGDDEDRMLRAVRDVLDAGVGLDLRAGVNAGHVFVGDLGGPTRRTFTVMGDAVNLAARLMQKAAPGELLASQAVLAKAATPCTVVALEPFHVKGKSEPIEAAVVAAVGTPAPASRAALPFVGRGGELGELLARAGSAAAGRGAVVDIVGEPGVGKTRLAEELVLRAGLPHLTAWCQPYEVSTPYAAARRLLREAAGIDLAADGDAAAAALSGWVASAAPDLLGLTPLLAVVFGADIPDTDETAVIDPRFRRERIHDAVARLATSALARPAVVRVEDVQWIDPASGDLLAHLLGGIHELPWLVVTTRAASAPSVEAALAATALTLELGPLDERSAATLVRAVVGDRLSDEEVESLAARAGGHPLFTTELAAAAVDATLDGVPDSVERLLTARIDTLAAPDRLLLREAAVLGLRFDLDLAGATLGAEAGTAARWAALDGFVIDEDNGWVRFRHGLVHRVAYDGLAFRRRREVHRRAGQALELRAAPTPEDEAELLSLHFHHAQDHRASWYYSRLAGERAGRKQANAEAAELLGRALAAAGGLSHLAPAEVAAVAEALGDAQEVCGRFDDAAVSYAQARKLLAAPEHQARLLRKAGVLRERAGRYPDALRWYGRGLTIVSRAGGGAGSEAELALAYAGVRYRQGKASESARWAERALARAVEAGDRGAEAHALYLLALVGAGSSGARAACGSRAVAIYEELGDLIGLANALNNLGIAAFYSGRWHEALDLYSRSADARRRAGDVVGTATQDNNIGEILSDQGRLDDAAALYRGARRMFEQARYPVGVAVVLANQGRLAARAGRHDEAEALLADALQRFREIGAGEFVVEVRLRQAEARLLAGDVSGAAAALASARDDGAARDPLAAASLRRLEGWCLLLTGRREAAIAVADEAVASARALEAAFLEALALRLRAEARGDPADAQRARAVFDALGVVAAPARLVTEDG